MGNGTNKGVRFNTEELKRDVTNQGVELANSVMQDVKETAVKVADRGLRTLFDGLIDWVNAKLSA